MMRPVLQDDPVGGIGINLVNKMVRVDIIITR
jgi:hypothetical protein